jgi:hypothetical protein
VTQSFSRFQPLVFATFSQRVSLFLAAVRAVFESRHCSEDGGQVLLCRSRGGASVLDTVLSHHESAMIVKTWRGLMN